MDRWLLAAEEFQIRTQDIRSGNGVNVAHFECDYLGPVEMDRLQHKDLLVSGSQNPDLRRNRKQVLGNCNSS